MIRHILSATIFTFLFSVVAFAQASLECSRFDNDYERQQCEERVAQNTRLVYRTRFLKPDTSLLSDSADAWILHLITFGGFSGKGLPTVTIRSTGDFACGESEPLQFKAFEPGKLKTLSEIITSANFTITDSLTKTENSLPFLCSDCYQTTILLARRESSGKTKSYSNTSKLLKYSQIAEKLSLIQRNVTGLAVCQN
jgi:hypothetical protein